MANAVIDVGEKVHVIMRRHFKEDIRRHFAGEVTAVADGVFRAVGYAFVFEAMKMEYRRLPEVRTRIFGILDSGYIINVFPPTVIIDRLRYHTQRGPLVITDGAGFSLEVNEYNSVS